MRRLGLSGVLRAGLGNTEVATGWDVGSIVGPFLDGALAGGLVQIAACMIITRLLLHD